MVSGDEVPPTFTIKPRIQEQDDGNRLLFECHLVANPKPEIAWFHKESQLRDDKRTVIKADLVEPNKYNVTLLLSDVIESDKGPYRVFAKNKQGEVSATINLAFTRKFSF
ncbi:twitchin-like protein [Leptotrombidium deliense]|uniref:Twitchin-like protein n=1 Tax=Leptotrombidium deliense TaxID=299467 RepID=A0A443SCF9_9ACAR|nr:twitchin-like protein [Leptotrombidium deliense]